MAKRKKKVTGKFTKRVSGRSTNSNSDKLIKTVSIINYVFAVLLFIGALFLFLGGTLVTSLGGMSFINDMLPEGITSGLVGGTLLFIAIIFVALGVLFVYLGKGIMQRKYWAKVVQIIVAIVVHLFNFPIGTAVGIFELYVLLMNKDTKTKFKK